MQRLKIQKESKGERIYVDGHELKNVIRYEIKKSAESMKKEVTVTFLVDEEKDTVSDKAIKNADELNVELGSDFTQEQYDRFVQLDVESRWKYTALEILKVLEIAGLICPKPDNEFWEAIRKNGAVITI